MSFEIKKASRTGVKALIGMYGRSGSGKTMSALLLARGLVGPSGRVTLIDSESGRGSLFADIVPGGYSVIDLEPPFSPERYQGAFEAAEKQSDCVVIDSLTHEHNGDGGVLDMQEAELDRMSEKDKGTSGYWAKRDSCKMASWIKPKIEHKKFLQRILRCKCSLICCLRGEEKTHVLKGEGNQKSKVITDEFSTPIFDPRFIFELLVNLETVAHEGQGGFVIPRKITHPTIAPLLPAKDQQIGIRHGEALARWCAGVAETKAGKSPEIATVGKLKKELWAMTTTIHNGDDSEQGRKLLSQHLWDEDYMRPSETLSGLTTEQLTTIIDKMTAKQKLQQVAA